jgi:para-aminobenzoate synthetase component 1
MVTQTYLQHEIEQLDLSKTPASTTRCWGFAGLPASELLPHLQRSLIAADASIDWQLIWLNNAGRPVIGLWPKTIWSVYFEQTAELLPDSYPNRYKVIKSCRVQGSQVTAYMSYTDWQNELINYSKTYEGNHNGATAINQQPSYQHGLMGFIGYDIAAYELSLAAAKPLTTQPCAVLGHYDIYLTQTDDITDGWELKVAISDSNNSLENVQLATLLACLDKLDNQLATINSTRQTTHSLAPTILTAKWHKSDYQQAFSQTQHYLQQGDCYQINLTQTWQGHLHATNNLYGVYNDTATALASTTTLIDYLPDLHRNTQAPFAGYLAINDLQADSLANRPLDNISLVNKASETISFELLSCSPELFFTFIKDAQSNKHHIRTQPIKGTMPRGSNIEQDLALKQQLVDSAKDRAENVMIVDLLRNDLGKYAKTGSVKVPQLFNIESFSNVHHMVSTITAELKAEAHPLAVLFGSLPAGSITGTPKKRAVEIISELETAARGAYCGTMGYMNFDGSGQWNVLIRTLQAKLSAILPTNSVDSVDNTDSITDINSNNARQVSLWAGGGITIASNCDAEYQECLDKVGNLLQVLTQADTDELPTT